MPDLFVTAFADLACALAAQAALAELADTGSGKAVVVMRDPEGRDVTPLRTHPGPWFAPWQRRTRSGIDLAVLSDLGRMLDKGGAAICLPIGRDADARRLADRAVHLRGAAWSARLSSRRC